jgi:dethiobiotin synthetase
MKKKFVIIAADTDCAKTITTAGLLAAAVDKKNNAIASKPIQTGSHDGRSSDLDFIFNTANLSVSPQNYQKLVLCKLKTPSSPLLASQLENSVIDLDEVVRKTLEAANDYDLFFIETAGGIYTPITCVDFNSQKSLPPKYETNADFAKRLECPVIISVPNRVGAISLGVMAVNCARNHGLQIAGAVFSQTIKPKDENDFAILKDNIETFQQMTNVKVISDVSFMENISGETLSPFFDAAIDFLRNL